MTSYNVSSERYVVQCHKCGSNIGLIAVSGNSRHVSGKGIDGAHFEHPILGGINTKVSTVHSQNPS